MVESATFRNGRGMATAKNFRADGEMKLVHQTRPEQGIIQFTTTLTEQPFDVPLLPQPPESGTEINLSPSAYPYHLGERAQLLQPGRVGATRGQDDNG